MDQNILKSFSRKLGITSLNVVRKAQEYKRLLDVKASSSVLAALKINGSCEIVMCLDLAAQDCSQHLDKPTLIRLSGLNKRSYLSSLQSLESVLELNSLQTIKEMGIQYGCSEACSLAEEILKRYSTIQNEKSCDQLDFKSSLFMAASLCAACRKLKVKVDGGKLRDAASVKKSTFDRLTVDLSRIAEDIVGDKKSPNRKRGKSFYEELENAVLDESPAPEKQIKEESEGDAKANFQLWKEKILAQAAAKKQSS